MSARCDPGCARWMLGGPRLSSVCSPHYARLMPLVGLVAGTRVESWLVSPADWDELKSTYKTLGVTMSCGQDGIPVTRGATQFFRHKQRTDCHLHEGGPESPEHLRTKAVVADTARKLGWKATVEYPAPDRSWIADVLIEKDGRRIAVEVQWSHQTAAVFQFRQARYEEAGLECFWLAGPKNADTTGAVPSHPLSGSLEQLWLGLPTKFAASLRRVSLEQGLTHVLRDEFAERVEAIATRLELSTWMSKCWRTECQRWVTFWYVSAVELESRCGQGAVVSIHSGYERWAASRLESLVQDHARDLIRKSGLAAPAKFDRRDSREMSLNYVAQICPHCGIVQGDGHIKIEPWRWTEYSIPYRAMFPFTAQALSGKHLCVDRGNGRCDGAVKAHTEPFPSEKRFWQRSSGHGLAEPLPPPRAFRGRSAR